MENYAMRKNLRGIVPLILAIAIVISIGWYLLIYDRNFTRDILLENARYFDDNGNAAVASWLYDLAYTTSGNDEDVAIELASQYKADGNYTKAEVTLTNAITDNPTRDLYIALCQTYVQQDKILDALNLLDSIPNPAIKAEVDALRPEAPVAETEPGFYSQYIPINFTVADATLYCNFEGDYPSTWDGAYTEPVTLPAGETTICAIAIAKNGLVSPMTTVSYTVGGVIEPAVFVDAVMEETVRALLNVDANEPLFTNDLWDITEFTVPQGVENYEDLQLLPYVQKLTLQGARLDTLGYLVGLTKLEYLDLSDSRFPPIDLTVLVNLPALTELNLTNCGLSSIADLTGAPALKVLNLSNNTIRNMDALSTISTLEELNLEHNAVTGLQALAALSNLTKLNLAHNSVSDLSPLANCVNLSWLHAGNNAISTITAVNQLPNLSYLALSYNSISDISILKECTSLTELYLSNNLLTNILALNNLSKLQVLDFAHNEVHEIPYWQDGGDLRIIDGSYNKIESIDTLWNMNSLTYVYMDYNALVSVGNLAKCPNLVMLNVYGNKIEQVDNLTARDIIVNWDPTT